MDWRKVEHTKGRWFESKPATKENEASQIGLAFSFAPEKSYNNIDMANKDTDPNLQAILVSLQKLPQADREVIAQALQSKPSSLNSSTSLNKQCLSGNKIRRFRGKENYGTYVIRGFTYPAHGYRL